MASIQRKVYATHAGGGLGDVRRKIYDIHTETTDGERRVRSCLSSGVAEAVTHSCTHGGRCMLSMQVVTFDM